MNNEIENFLGKQSDWQRSRRTLSWPEKIHLAERVRESVGRWSQSSIKMLRKESSQPRKKKKAPGRAAKKRRGKNAH